MTADRSLTKKPKERYFPGYGKPVAWLSYLDRRSTIMTITYIAKN
jgi:hypothetical protein